MQWRLIIGRLKLKWKEKLILKKIDLFKNFDSKLVFSEIIRKRHFYQNILIILNLQYLIKFIIF